MRHAIKRLRRVADSLLELKQTADIGNPQIRNTGWLAAAGTRYTQGRGANRAHVDGHRNGYGSGSTVR